jgi:hypothetical protein
MGFNRLKRAAVLAGVGALVVAGAVLGSAQAHASTVFGTQPGALTFTPSSGVAATTTPTFNSTACPAGFNGSGHLYFIDPNTPAGTPFNAINKDELSNAILGTAAAFSGTLNAPIGNVPGDIGGLTLPVTVEATIYCQTAGNGTGAGEFIQDSFVTFNADGTFSASGTAPAGPISTTTTLQASSPAFVGQNVTLTATVAGGSTAPTGTVTFENGSTTIGSGPVTLVNGQATVTAQFAAAGTQSLSAVYTPAAGTSFVTSTGTLSLSVTTPPANSGVIPLAVTVPTTGAFTLTVDTTTVVNLTVAGLTGTGATTPIGVSDTRNTYPGWSVSGQDSAWTGSGTAVGGTFSGNQLGWTPTDTLLAPAVVLGPTVAPVPGGPGLGTTAAVLASAPHGLGNGYGTSTLGANLNLAIPATAPAGPYTSGLTISAVTSN